MRLLAPVLSTGLTAVDTGMRGVDGVAGGMPLTAMLIVGVPWGAVVAAVAVCLVATFVFPLVVGVLRVLAGPIKVVCGSAVCVGVFPRV